MIVERAPAKVNLVLHVGPRRADGLHELCSLFASLELADRVEVEPLAEGREDRIRCPGVEGPNLAAAALATYREVRPSDGPPALEVRIDKRVPVAGGLGGGSADAAAVLRAADALASDPLGPERLRELGMRLGADVPSQVWPRHAVVTGAGEHVEPVELPGADLVLVPQRVGLATADVYAEADRRGDVRARLDPEALRALAASGSLEELLPALENDLEPAARALRPELAAIADKLRARGARAALLSGSGPTLVGLFASPGAARAAAEAIEGATLTRLRATPLDALPAGATAEGAR